MKEESNNNRKVKLEHRLTDIESDIGYIKDDLQSIKKQVYNHIPSTLEQLNNKLGSFIVKSGTRFTVMLLSIVGLLVGVIIDILIKR